MHYLLVVVQNHPHTLVSMHLMTFICFLFHFFIFRFFSVERLWSTRDATSTGNMNTTVLPRLEYFRCLLNQRGVPAAPVTNEYARKPPIGPGSCYVQ